MNDFDAFTKLPNNEGNFGKTIVAQSPINRPKWSNWLQPTLKGRVEIDKPFVIFECAPY